MSTEDFADFFYNACLIDWGAQSKIQEGIKEKFESGKVLRILGDETDLYLGIEGRNVKKCIGKC